jgi:hypothetical protein
MALAIHLPSLVYAHTTLGKLNDLPPYFRSNDHELNPTNTFGAAHVPGPLGYVWPSGGSDFYTGVAGFPGYQSPFENYEEPLQAEGTSYSPEGAILTSSPKHDNVGDLIFAINFSQPNAFITPTNPSPTFRYNNISLYIPAPFQDKHGELVQDGFEPVGGINWALGDASNILTTLTNDYGRILVTKADMNDPFCPGWWIIRITPSGNGLVFTPDRKWQEWYYIRINQLRTPDVAGRYFFKIFLGDHYPVKSQSAPLVNSTMPAENWPLLLVKGELDPAIIYGTVRYGEESNPELYGQPINLPGRVRAVGIASDPITGSPTGRVVEARGYFNASAKGRFEIEGVAPGIYNLYASAAGLPELIMAQKIIVYRGQSLGIDLYLELGPEIIGEIDSKSCIGSTPWKEDLPISVVIYDSDNYLEDNVVSYSPLNLTHAPYTSYVTGNTIFSSGRLLPPNSPKPVAFPWEGPISYYPFTALPPFRDPSGIYNGVGPAQIWWVSPTGSFDPVTGLGSGPTSFRFQFGSQRYFGAPHSFSGMIPQVFATWIDGLGPGTYFVRAYVNGYVQTDVSGSNFRDYYFTVAKGQTISVALQMDIWLSGMLNLTVHFHDVPGSMRENPIGGPDPGRFLVVEALDSQGVLSAFNFTFVPALSSSASLTLDGLGMAGVMPPPDPRAGIKYSLFRYRGLRDYGIYPGLYSLHMYSRGYIQALAPGNELIDLDRAVGFSISTCNSTSLVSAHMFRGGGINTTIYSSDWESPPVQRPWRYNGTTTSVLVYDVASDSFVDAINFWDSITHMWTVPTTESDFSVIPWPNWRVVFGPSASMLITNGSTILERIGPDLPSPPSLFPQQDIATNVFFQASIRLGFLYQSTFYRTPNLRSTVAIYPGQYAITGWTYGYVQEGVTTLGDLGRVIISVGMGQIADAPIRLIKGVEFNLVIDFEKEDLPTALPYNVSMRISVYDNRDALVAAASTSLDIGAVQPSLDLGFFADGKKVTNASGATAIPAGTRHVEYKGLAGLLSYVDPTSGAEALRLITLFSPDSGIWGSSTTPLAGMYTGEWYVIVEMANWYRPTEFYPPPFAVLQGELHPSNMTAILPYNHLGPFEQRETIKLPGASLGGGSSATFSLHMRGQVHGTIAFYNMRRDLRSVSWASITYQNNYHHISYSWDGLYETYLPHGVYTITVDHPGLTSQSSTVTVPDGGIATCYFYLAQCGIPIPEYNIVQFPFLTIIGIGFAYILTIVMNNRRKR